MYGHCKGWLATALGLVMVLGGVVPACAGELLSTLQDQQQVAVTIYDGNLALVKDRRRVDLPAGESRLAIREVSGGMMAETAMLQEPDGRGGLRVIEQSFDNDLLTPQKLLQHHVGKTVQVVRVHPQTGAETLEPATVLAAVNGVVLRMGDRIETGIPGRLVFNEVPADLRDRPTLVVHLDSDRAGRRDLELSYLTSGLTWSTDYVAQLSADEKSLELSAWVTLDNRSGSSYRDARLQLVAGEVNRVRRGGMERAAFDLRETRSLATAPAVAEEGLLDFHLYTLERPTTLASNQSKQVALLAATRVPVRKEYRLQGREYYYRGQYGDLGERLRPDVFVEFDNRSEGGLGMPLPRGILSVYKNDRAGRSQFVGEDRIDHTARNETVRLRLGAAFDVTARRTQTDYKQLSAGPKDRLVETAYRIVLSNGGETDVTVNVVEPISGDWQILQESQRHTKLDARTAAWQVQVPADGEAQLTYRVRVRY